MKEYFYEKDNEVYILDDEKGLLVEDAKDNTEEMLITQNNIERIMNELEDSEINKRNLEKFTKSEIKRNLIASFVALFMIWVTLVVGCNTIPAFGFLVSACYALVIIAAHKEYFEHKRSIKQFCAYIKELKIELEKENENLKTLKEKSKDKKVEYTRIKEVPKGKVIENLNRKKDLIIEYFENRKKYIILFNVGLLHDILKSSDYNENDVEFIEYLIKEDLNSKKITQQKGKSKVKKY